MSEDLSKCFLLCYDNSAKRFFFYDMNVRTCNDSGKSSFKFYLFLSNKDLVLILHRLFEKTFSDYVVLLEVFANPFKHSLV